MGLFDVVASALDNPEQQASNDQLGSILSTVQQLAGGQGADSAATQALMSVVGSHVRSALKDNRTSGGTATVEDLVGQLSGTGANPAALQKLFTPQQQEQLVQTAASKTGLNADKIQAMLPVLIPIVMKLLQSGARKPTASAPGQPARGNSVLDAFLDTDNDGDVDVGDAFSLASRYLMK